MLFRQLGSSAYQDQTTRYDAGVLYTQYERQDVGLKQHPSFSLTDVMTSAFLRSHLVRFVLGTYSLQP